MSEYRVELIQIAAVTLAMLQDDMNGSTEIKTQEEFSAYDLGPFINAVMNERIRQEAKWGPQHHSKEKWLTILTEEVGEVARAILENK